MRFFSNCGCKIIVMCSVNFWYQQDSNLLFKGSIGHVPSQCKWPIQNYHKWYLSQISHRNHVIISLQYYLQKVCNFHMQVFQIKLKYHCSKPTKLQKFLMQQLQSSSKVLGRMPFLPLLFLPPPTPGPMLIKTLMFVRAIVLFYLNIEQGGRWIFSKRENSPFSGLKWTTVQFYNLPN